MPEGPAKDEAQRLYTEEQERRKKETPLERKTRQEAEELTALEAKLAKRGCPDPKCALIPKCNSDWRLDRRSLTLTLTLTLSVTRIGGWIVARDAPEQIRKDTLRVYKGWPLF